MLAGAHKKFYRIQHPEIYLLDLKVQYKHKMKLPLDMVSKHVLSYLCLPDYNLIIDNLKEWTGSVSSLGTQSRLHFKYTGCKKKTQTIENYLLLEFQWFSIKLNVKSAKY